MDDPIKESTKPGKNVTKRNIGPFISAVVFFQIFPLLPLWFEYQNGQSLTYDSLILCTSMYAFVTGASSKHESLLAVFFLLGFVISAMYTPDAENVEIIKIDNLYKSLTFYTLLIIFFGHLVERYQRHIEEKEPFFIFAIVKDKKEQ